MYGRVNAGEVLIRCGNRNAHLYAGSGALR
jgi:hypothetical protein